PLKTHNRIKNIQSKRMSNSIMLFFVLSLFFISSTSSSSSAAVNNSHKCSVQQTLALLQFKQNLSSINFSFDDTGYSPCEDWLGSGYKPIMMNWNTSTDCCNWNGVTCDHPTGDVIGLDLSCGMLQVPTHISHLQKLVSLDLSFNWDFNLERHVFINLLQNSTVMKQLSLEDVNISSVLPTNLNISSSSLKLLNLGYTELQGNLPHSIFNLQSLENLDLSGNSLTGNIPSEISLLPKLVSLDLSFNSIDNLLIQPHIFRTLLTNFTFLRDLRLDKVNIGSALPTYINISSPLRSLGLRSTSLQGKLPDNIFNLEYLEVLDLSANNNLSGPFPKVNTSSSIRLRRLDLSGTSLSGEIPTSIGHLTSLDDLILSNCGLNGSLPKSLGNLKYLEYLSLSNNIGDWELDALLSSLPNLDTLILSHSGISVTTSNASNHYVNPALSRLSLASCNLKVFPVFIRAMTNLIHLDLSNNDIQGHIPDWIGEIGRNRLAVLNLANNSLTGTIPNVYEDWCWLEGFILKGNQLEGNVPTSLNKCQSLKVIDLGNNYLSDTFPCWLGDLPNLQALILRSNNFHGAILTSSKVEFPFQRLQVLDLSHNGFVGQLPTNYFQNFNAMKNVARDNREPNYVYIAVKGVDLYFPLLLVDYTIVDLSDNQFHGEIPNITGYLKSLKVLNLSHNSLTGRIPQALGLISEIESLDLSWNQLTGEIPQSLADLTFLELLNLSQNHLVGRIPQGKQFNTFDGYSFGGNLKLCGLPLPKKCGEHLQKPQLEGDGDGEEENGFTWKVVVMGYGCGALLGIVWGYLMLTTGRPK
ncbi:hypothetical protein M8C21_028818, partial [Ambrosia artemisiifolia]